MNEAFRKKLREMNDNLSMRFKENQLQATVPISSQEFTNISSTIEGKIQEIYILIEIFSNKLIESRFDKKYRMMADVSKIMFIYNNIINQITSSTPDIFVQKTLFGDLVSLKKPLEKVIELLNKFFDNLTDEQINDPRFIEIFNNLISAKYLFVTILEYIKENKIIPLTLEDISSTASKYKNRESATIKKIINNYNNRFKIGIREVIEKRKDILISTIEKFQKLQRKLSEFTQFNTFYLYKYIESIKEPEKLSSRDLKTIENVKLHAEKRLSNLSEEPQYDEVRIFLRLIVEAAITLQNIILQINSLDKVIDDYKSIAPIKEE